MWQNNRKANKSMGWLRHVLTTLSVVIFVSHQTICGFIKFSHHFSLHLLLCFHRFYKEFKCRGEGVTVFKIETMFQHYHCYMNNYSQLYKTTTRP